MYFILNIPINRISFRSFSSRVRDAASTYFDSCRSGNNLPEDASVRQLLNTSLS